MLNKKALIGTASAPPVFVDDVFSTFLYTGTGSSQTITNGIDLAGKGGLVWWKKRNGVSENDLRDTIRGVGQRLISNRIDISASIDGVSSFNNNGFTVTGINDSTNAIGDTYCSWTFREQAKFFDVVTYTGTGSARTVAHNLGSVPGMIIVKRTDDVGSWFVYHRSLASASDALRLNATTAVETDSTIFNGTAPTSSVFSVGTFASTNASGGTYVAYLFAHDAGGFGTAGTDNVISCGSFTTDGSGNATVNLGYEPQYFLSKESGAAGDSWYIEDVMRGFNQTASALLQANSSAAEASVSTYDTPTATGVNVRGRNSSATFIYMAIRRPMKPPTSGTQVFSPVAYTGNGSTRSYSVGFPTDVSINMNRDEVGDSPTLNDRLRGLTDLYTNATQAETTTSQSARVQFDNQTNIIVPSFRITNTIKYIDWCFRRAPGFMDVVCYTGTGVARTLNHNLGSVPELMIVKLRNSATNWVVYTQPTGNTNYLYLNTTLASTAFNMWNSTSPTSSVFSVSSHSQVNGTGDPFVAYLFATLAGVSKVGSYTGTGAAQVINCGFTAGARFVLIKRTDSTGDWFVWDTARGIVSGNDPYLLLNSSAAEVTNTDFIDPVSSGFEISSTAPAAINASGGSFIFLAIA